MENGIWEKGLEELYSDFSASPSGLSSEEAKARLEKYGPNAIPDKDKKGWLDVLVSQLRSPFLLILIAASLLAGLTGELSDMAIILFIVAVSALLGFFQEYKSEKVLSELKKYFSNHAIVMRNSEKLQVDSRELVPGDVVFLALGDIVPADARIIETSGILVSESALTGESKPVRKFPGKAALAKSPQDIGNGLFMGTTVIEGYAKCLVVRTGKETFFGKTAEVFSSKVPESDFQRGIRNFGKMITWAIVLMTLFVFLANFIFGKNTFADSLLFALALAVGVAPEALPVIITVALSSGSMHLAKKSVVTKKLAAIEDLGDMDVLCTDKTGTLTEEGIRMDRYVDFDMKDSHDVFQYALLCNSAVGTVHFKGNPIDVAIKRRGHRLKTDLSGFRKVWEIPFDYERRRMGQVVSEGGKCYLIVKGAPESVLSVCSKARMSGKAYGIRGRDGKETEIERMIAGYNEGGHSTIGVAYKEIEKKKDYSKEDENGLIFMGFVLFSNPPKPDVRATLQRLKALNIRLKILTGDDPLVTKKLCSDVGFAFAGGRIVLGSELGGMTGEEVAKAVEEYDVFARVSPDQKLLIVEKLRANGHVVGFLGDGINDAPALRTADVGISVNTAADVAKGASHIILLKKSLGVVCDGAEEGRKIFGNITKYIMITISANNGNMITVAASSLFLPFIPLLPSQILLNNLVSDVPMLSISGDKVDASYTKKPQKWDIGLIAKFMLFFGLISTFFDLLLIGVMYFVFKTPVDEFRTAWFLESVLSEIVIIFSLRTHMPFFKSIPSPLLVVSAVGAGILSVSAIYFAPTQELFKFVPLGLDTLTLIGGILAAYFVASELGKIVFFGKIAPASRE